MTDKTPGRADCIHFYLCTQMHCARRVVSVRIHAADAATMELTGPDLVRALRELVVERDLTTRIQVRETSCMRGCLVGPRLNVTGTGGFREAMRYLHLPAARHNLSCFPWEGVVSLEELVNTNSKGG
ncbi:MAG: hypothetical protein HY267_05445 [Deltaproteobacteria bacterium]|nr:hypothetical protein [Deltaproteobacteria bacterium]